GGDMAELISGLSTEAIIAAREAIEAEISAACQRAERSRSEVELLLASKYVPIDESGKLLDADITLVGENRAQDLIARAEAYPDRFTFDFIGALQSRKVKLIVPYVRLIHSVASDSVLAQLEKHGTPETKALVEVNISGEQGKAGVAADELDDFIARCPVPVLGLMTMPPLSADPELSRASFAALRELAQERGLEQLSMGTTQDFAVAIEEGATIVRIGSRLLR
ncbi:MAG: YggS family pyridoxal phosphate-dependent enzyme, partial [Actinomycetes bacterium]